MYEYKVFYFGYTVYNKIHRKRTRENSLWKTFHSSRINTEEEPTSISEVPYKIRDMNEVSPHKNDFLFR